jgi:enamine deaminase RidA (YjgF/YER057c/UK114 family)
MSQAVQAGNLVFVSGQVAVDGDGRIVGEGDFRAQADQCFRNIEALLAPLGGTIEDVTKITTFLTDVRHGPDYMTFRAERFRETGPPASSTVVVAGLLDPRFLIEVEAIAVLGS